jgi:hypothetical protein
VGPAIRRHQATEIRQEGLVLTISVVADIQTTLPAEVAAVVHFLLAQPMHGENQTEIAIPDRLSHIALVMTTGHEETEILHESGHSTVHHLQTETLVEAIRRSTATDLPHRYVGDAVLETQYLRYRLDQVTLAAHSEAVLLEVEGEVIGIGNEIAHLS